MKSKSASSNPRVQVHELRVQIRKYELKSTSFEFKFTICEFNLTSYGFKSTSYEFNFSSYEFKSTSYEFKSTSSRTIWSIKTQVTVIFQGPKSSIFWQFVKQLVHSVSGDNLVLYFSTISWLRLQQKTEWVNINFERAELTSAHKSHHSPMNLEKPFQCKICNFVK